MTTLHSPADPIRFTLSEDDRTWPGFAHGSKWNGFDNVYVTVAVRDEIVAYLTECAPTPADVVDFVSDVDEIEPYEYDGQMVVSLGWGYVTTIVEPLRVCPNCGADQYECRSNGCPEA
jgi:hypothetical protein